MKLLGLTILAAAALALPICAQERTLRADVPFEYMVRNETLPAGNYVISLTAGNSIVKMQGDRKTCLFLTGSDAETSNEQFALVFHRYGDQYFLAQIKSGSRRRDVPESRAERDLRRRPEVSGRQVRQDVLVAMR